MEILNRAIAEKTNIDILREIPKSNPKLTYSGKFLVVDQLLKSVENLEKYINIIQIHFIRITLINGL